MSRDPNAAPVQGMVPRDLATDILAAQVNWTMSDAAPGAEAEHIATELTRLGWVHSSQATALRATLETHVRHMGELETQILQLRATGGGLSGEARSHARNALRYSQNLYDMMFPGLTARVIAEIEALPVRGDGTV